MRREFVRLSVFDLDHTLINVNSSFRYFAHLCRQKHFSYNFIIESILLYYRFRFLKMTPKDLHIKVFQKFFEKQNVICISVLINCQLIPLDKNLTKRKYYGNNS